MTRRHRMLDGLDADIRDHIERETRDNIERGMTPAEARAAALRAFGNVARVEEDTRAVWSRVWLEQLLQDIRYGCRTLRRNPGFAAVVVLTLALGVGMNTAIFAVVNAVLLRPLDYPHPEQLVWIADHDPNTHRDVVFLTDFYEWRANARSYAAMAAYGYQQSAIQGAAVDGVAVAGDFWRLTGARPAIGRLFAPGEQNVAVLTWQLFDELFHADPAAVGRTVLVDGRPFTLAGVLPRTFRFQLPVWWTNQQSQAVEAYVPLQPSAPALYRNVNAIAALNPGVTPPQALAELEALEQGIGQRRPAGGPPAVMTKLRVEPLPERLVSGAREALLVLLAAGVFVLLIASGNMANLLLARASSRQREIAIRAAVGAGRWRTARQFLVESALLAVLGGAAGLVLARWSIAALVRISPNAVPRLAETGVDGAVIAFTLAISLASGLIFGAGPAILLWRVNLAEALKEGARTSAGGSGLFARRALVAGELALAIVLLTGAGLMIKSFWRMHAHPAGFEPEHILSLRVRLSGPLYAKRAAQEVYTRELARRIEAAPGAQSAGISIWFLFAGPRLPNDPPDVQSHVIRLHAVSAGYLQTMGLRLLRGRWLNPADTWSTAVLTERMARVMFGNQDPIGRTFPVMRDAITVVGVVGDLKYSKLDADPEPEAYLPIFSSPVLGNYDVAIRTAGNPDAIAQGVRKAIAGIDPAQPAFELQSMEHALAGSIAPRRFNFFLLGSFAAVALLLAMVGIYGVVAYSVAGRTREIGVRMALGARRAGVVRMVIGEGMTMAAGGLVVGLVAAWGLTRLMAGLLYDVKANDPATFAAVAAALLATAVLACWVPALRAAWIDPSVALREE